MFWERFAYCFYGTCIVILGGTVLYDIVTGEGFGARLAALLESLG